ncbi:MAG: hypothetical protein CVU09_08850 [Bacteroidetes bacterium HGW-Bacteroidetes-4]|nr:MAG: hypothetical protein CVU09_08850 [Bacteroidetes bacterium HGW-Bacteroidetes-4]
MQLFKNTLIYLTLILCSGTLFASGNTWLVGMQTDRYCYVSGDVAYVKAICFLSKQLPVVDQTLYIDLLTADSVFIRGYLLQLLGGKAQGYFEIPDTLTTGNYKLRIYTDESKRWKNPVIASQWLYVTNRFGKNQPLYESNLVLPELTDSSPGVPVTQNIRVIVDKEKYRQRSKVNVQVSLPPELNETFWGSLSVKTPSVLESQMENYNLMSKFETGTITTQDLKSDEAVYSGIKIRGQLVYKKSLQGIPNAAVLLTFEDSVIRMQYHLTDSLGNFCFYLSGNYGKASVYFNAFDYHSMKPLSEVSFNVFDGFLKPEPMSSTHKRLLGYKPSTDTLNLQKSTVAKAFQLSNHVLLPPDLPDALPFAQRFLSGKLTDVVFPADFVDLTDFAEIAKEILPYIRYRKVDGDFRFSIIDGPNHLIKHNPLVFVDGVPLVESGKLAQLNTADIKRVDVKSQARFYGDLFFENGLVFIWTHKMNFWKQTQSAYNELVELQLYQHRVSFHFPDYSKGAQPNLPDFRQPLYWNPGVNLTGDNTLQFEFYTSDEKGTFDVVIEGVNSKGEFVLVKKTFNVQ